MYGVEHKETASRVGNPTGGRAFGEDSTKVADSISFLT